MSDLSRIIKNLSLWHESDYAKSGFNSLTLRNQLSILSREIFSVQNAINTGCDIMDNPISKEEIVSFITEVIKETIKNPGWMRQMKLLLDNEGLKLLKEYMRMLSHLSQRISKELI